MTTLDSFAQTADSTLTPSMAHTLGASANLVLIFVFSEGAVARPSFDTITYGGVVPTAAEGTVNGTARSQLYYIKSADLPAAGSNTLAMTIGNSATQGTGMHVVSFVGAPEIAAGPSTGDSTSSPSAWNFPSDTTLDNALLFTTAGRAGVGTIDVGASAIQTAQVTLDSATGSSRFGWVLDAGVAGAKDVTWTTGATRKTSAYYIFEVAPPARGEANVWNGTAWVGSAAKRWNGSAWA